MDIFIKSCNRAYLLDRVLKSIYRYVKNGLGQIMVLDDGTPEKYLDKIQKKYPSVKIKTSPDYRTKVEGKTGHVPIQFWRDEMKAASDYFMLLEDDIWLAQDIDLSDLNLFLIGKKISFFKLRWWGNPKMVSGNYKGDSANWGILTPRLPFAGEWLVKNKYYLHSICILLHIMPKDYFLPLYSLYDVAGHIFSREFYQYVWPSDQAEIQEMIQLGRAAEWFRKMPSKEVGRTVSEYAATTFLSSSTGKRAKLGFDMMALNHHLNEAWYQDQFDPLFNFPNDFTLAYITSYLKHKMSPDAIAAWKKWSIGWRKHFTALGSDLNKYNNPYECE